MRFFLDKWYLKPKLSPGLVALFTAQTIKAISWYMLGLFLPIFLYERFGSLPPLLIYYLMLSLVYIFVVPIGAKMMSYLGLKKSMIISLPFLSGYFLCFIFIGKNLFLFLGLALSLVVLYKMLFWIPYHSVFAKLTTLQARGREISFLRSVASVVKVIIPVLGGTIIVTVGFNQLFIIAAVLAGVSMIPLIFLKEREEKFVFSYWQTFREFFKKANRKLMIAYGADGAEGGVALIIWPIFIYGILEKKYLAVGAISSLIILTTILLRLIIGTYLDRIKKRNIIRIGSILYAFGWVMKMFLRSGFQIFVVGTYHDFAGIIKMTSFDTLMYEEAADHGMFVDEYSAIREISFHFGRVLILAALFVLVGFFGVSMSIAFLLAAIVSLFINVL